MTETTFETEKERLRELGKVHGFKKRAIQTPINGQGGQSAGGGLVSYPLLPIGFLVGVLGRIMTCQRKLK
jgi:hypothetical protein